MYTEIDKARSLFDDFEKKSLHLNGINSLSDALLTIYDALSSTEDDRIKRKAQNLVSTIKKFIISNVNKLNPEDPYEVLEYWYSVLQEIIDIDFENNEELIALQNMLHKYREKARKEALSEKQQLQELISWMENLPKKKKENIRKLLLNEESSNS